MSISVPEPTPAAVLAFGGTSRLPEPFKCRVSRWAEATVVAVRGEIDMATAPTLEDAIDSVQWSASRVVVDLSKVSFLDSTALNTLVDCHRRLSERAVVLRVVLPPDQVIRKLFEVSALIEPLGVVESIDHALWDC